MLSKKQNIQKKLIAYTLEELVPEHRLYGKIEDCIDFCFIYQEVKDLY